MAYIKKSLLTILAAPLFVLQGCGFHLQAKDPSLPICINGKSHQQLKKQLNTKCTNTSFHLDILASSMSQSDISNSMNNNVRQYQLEHFIVFTLKTNKQKIYKNNVKISINKPYIVNNNSILSSNAEREILNSEMQNELIKRMKFYLHSQLL